MIVLYNFIKLIVAAGFLIYSVIKNHNHVANSDTAEKFVKFIIQIFIYIIN